MKPQREVSRNAARTNPKGMWENLGAFILHKTTSKMFIQDVKCISIKKRLLFCDSETTRMHHILRVKFKNWEIFRKK